MLSGGNVDYQEGPLALFSLEDLFSVLSDVCCSCHRWKHTPHEACKCFCTTCKAFLEVASKKGFYRLKKKKKCNCVIVYICNFFLPCSHYILAKM